MVTEKIFAAGEAQMTEQQLPCAATKSMSSLVRRSTPIVGAFAPIGGYFRGE